MSIQAQNEKDTVEYKNEKGKVLVCGSGGYMKEWIKDNKALLAEYDEVFCINTVSVLMDYPHIWAVSVDFFWHEQWTNRFMAEKDFKAINSPWVKFSVRKFLNKPLAFKGADTMFLNTVYHINNIYDGKTRMDCIGCDFDYTSPKTHFYPDGKPDPIRNGTDKLLEQLAVAVKEVDIHNISGNPNALWGKP